ncbi:MAG: CpaF/VirB11 family protein [Halarcobacter ebronensis]|uniref:CpaF/VirB11 family protein n=1 Tax=Halarcobacter ebronensis TaxID=1462615 RepID=UPI003C709CD8
MKSDKILQNLLSKIQKYLTRDDTSEIILHEIGIVRLDTINGFKDIKDSNITYQFLNDLPSQLATFSNQDFSPKSFTLSSNIPGTNYRVTATHSNVLDSNCNSILIRKPLGIEFKISNYIDKKEDITLIIDLIKKGFNLLIIGGTGTGKTSLLNKLIEYIDLKERIVAIQDSAELIIPHKNKDLLMVSKNGSNISNLDYKSALDLSMRMRPDRILLGEIDSVNTLAFLRLGNTGHKGMVSTLHTNSPLDTLNALQLNLMLSGFTSNKKALNGFISSAIDYVIKVQKVGKFEKKVTDIKTIKEIIEEESKLNEKDNHE